MDIRTTGVEFASEAVGQPTLHHLPIERRAALYKSFTRSCLPIILLVACGTLALLPAMIYGIPSGPDLPAHFRNALSFNQSIHEGHIYPSWSFAPNNGFGDAIFRVYPPGIFYILSATHVLTGDWYVGSLLAFTLLSVVGCLGVYFWASSLYPRRVAMWAGAFYALAPFHINELYQASLLPEFAGGTALAFAFGFTERVCRRGRALDMAGLSITYALLIFTHPPLAMMGSLAIIAYALLRIERGCFKPTSIKLLLGIGLGLAASACYWTTLVAELAWTKGDKIDPGVRYDFRRNFLFTTFSVKDSRIWWANMLGLAMVAMILPAFAPSRARQEKTLARRTTAVKLLTLFSLLMATPLSWPLWAIIPKLGSIEYPWRWLAVTSVAGSVGVAASISYWKEKSRGNRPFSILALGSLLISFAFTLSQPIRQSIFLARPQFEALLQTLPQSESLPEFVPVWVKGRLPTMHSEVEVEQRKVTVTSWATEQRTFQVGSGDAADAHVRTFYYPLWVATAGNKSLPTRPAADGSLLISLPAEEVSVRLEFREPFRAHVAAAVSALACPLVVALFVFGWRKKAAVSPTTSN